eukprot:302716-Pyramimonas_sp.AAC.1
MLAVAAAFLFVFLLPSDRLHSVSMHHDNTPLLYPSAVFLQERWDCSTVMRLPAILVVFVDYLFSRFCADGFGGAIVHVA